MTDLNNISPLKYKINVTNQYIQIKCEKCKLFAHWYKNDCDIHMKDLYEMDGGKLLRPKKGVDLNLIYFRGIQRNHF
jgi:hypothetical protein